MVHSSITEWSLLTNHFIEIYTNRTIDRETTQDSYGLHLYWTNWFDKYGSGPRQMHVYCWRVALAVETEAPCECRHVSQPFSSLKLGFSRGTFLSVSYAGSFPTRSPMGPAHNGCVGARLRQWHSQVLRMFGISTSRDEKTNKCFSHLTRK